ncbi:branched-chain amino acid ABC transporter permease [Longispora albida]|uniref:branched-chain amino acid ABC transporter permease n=1 Tax=Longispora albida TaxID=203523 RepID=UPI0004756C52|nr:branched-chain amino acid ABC transporter permease [Longispora albida]
MEQLVNIVFVGLATGTTYALVGLGIALVFQVTGVINFAQGDFVMLGGILFALLAGKFADPAGSQLGLFPAALLALAITTLIGILVYLLVIAPARKAGHDRLIILTIGASITIQGLATLAFGTDPYVAPRFSGQSLEERSVDILGVPVDTQYLWCAAITGVAVVAMWQFLTRTTLGTGMRATAMDPETSRLMGISPQRMALLAFGLAAGLGALGGTVLAPLNQPDTTVGIALGLKGFAAAVLGGLDSPAGAIAGGLAFGLVETFVIGYAGTEYKDTIGFGLLLAVLLFRPTGLLRRASVVKV